MDALGTQVTQRTELLSISLEGDALLDEVAASLTTVERLVTRLDRAGDLGDLSVAAKRIEQRLGRRELSVALAGVPGSGKRTFLEAVVGDARLGRARGTAGMPTFLRSRATPRYRARFTDGSLVDFAQLIPDRSREHDERLTSAEETFLEAERAHAVVAARARTAGEALTRAREDLGRFSRAAASAQEVEAAIGADFASAEAAKDQASRALAVAEQPIPKRLRTWPDHLGFWLRLWRALFVFFRRELWQGFVVARQALHASEERLAGMRERALSSARERQQATAELALPQATAEARREEHEAAERAAAEALAEQEEAKALMEQRRAELARYVEERWAAFFDGLQQLSDESGRAADVLEVSVDYPARHLPEDVAILDVPELADPARRQRSRVLLRSEADGCILVWDVEQPVEESAVELWRGIRSAMPHLLVVITKMDATFLDAVRAGHPEPWTHVEEARRAATRRLAIELGEEPDRLLSVAVAAHAAVEDESSGLARRFAVEVTKLFQLVRQERAIGLGARSAELVEGCIGLTRMAEHHAERAYRQRVTELEASRVAEPEAFHRQAIQQAEAVVERAVARAVDAATASVRGEHARLAESRPRGLVDAERSLATGVANVQKNALSTLEIDLTAALEALEGRVFAELERRYRVAGVRTLRTLPLRLDTGPIELVALAQPRVPKRISAFRRVRFALGALGAALGAAAGTAAALALASRSTMPLPLWAGGALGALLGTTLAFVKTWSSVEQAALAELREALETEERGFTERLAALGPRLCTALREALDASVERVIIRHGRSMTAPAEAAEEALSRERSNLGELREIAGALERHDDRLRALGSDATELSRELCR